MDRSQAPPVGEPRPLPDPVELGGTGIEDGVYDGLGDLPGRLERYGKARLRALSVLEYGRETCNTSAPIGGRGASVASVLGRLDRCGNYLEFHHYHSVDQVRLARADFCKQHLLCQLCAARRGSTYMGAYLPKFLSLMTQYPHLKPVLVTLTVKSREGLADAFAHLMGSYRVLADRRRTVRKGNRGKTEWAKVAGLVGAVEFTHGANGWHPHIHAIALVDSWLDQKALSREWHEITGDSFIVGLTALKMTDPAKSFAEVFKYAVKFSDLSPELTWEAYRTLGGARLVFSVGCFRGVEVPDSLTDVPIEGLPYTAYFYRFLRNSGYNVVSVTRHA
jgi:hypothetical protein